MHKTEVWAHRGASGYAPENTLEAFQLALDMGVDGVELDVQMSRDGFLMVAHDEVIDRVSDGHGYLRDFTLRQLKGFHFSKTHPAYTEACIPTLQEVYELLQGTGVTVNVELKTGVVDYEGIEERVLELTRQMGMEGQVWYSSFNHYTVRRMCQLAPGVRAGILYADGIYDPFSYGHSLGAQALHPAYRNLRYPGMSEGADRWRMRVHVWTADDEVSIRRCYEMGVDAVITNFPDIAIGLREDV